MHSQSYIKRMRYFRYLNCFAFMAIWMFALTLTGCDLTTFQKQHPKEAQVIEDVVDVGEKVAEQAAESELHLPSGSLKPVFVHPLFDEDGNELQPAK